VWNIVEALDNEKMAILDALGYQPVPYLEACKRRNSDDPDRDAKDVFDEYARNHSVRGPSIPDSRYITEDVPEGLVLLEDLGRHLNIATPICTSLIHLADAAMDMDYRNIGRTIETLGEANLRMISKDDGLNLF
jgi:opine dehydrogenase